MVRVDPFLYMRDHGYPYEIKVSLNPSYEDLMETDVVYIHRGHTDEHLKTILNAKRLGKKIWADVDDDLLNIPIDFAIYSLWSHPEIKQNIVRILQLADVVSVSSKELLTRYQKYNENCEFLPCVFDERILQARMEPSKERKKIITWRGSPTHMKSLMEFADAIVEVEHRHPGWRWEFIGQNPWWIIERFKNSEVQVVNWIEPMIYFERMQRLQPAVNFVVHTDNSFTRCRSNLSYIDSTMAGAILIAPDWEHFKLPGVELYKQSDKNNFIEAFDTILEEFENGESFHQSTNIAWEYILKHMTFKRWNEKRTEIMDKLFHVKQGRKLCALPS